MISSVKIYAGMYIFTDNKMKRTNFWTYEYRNTYIAALIEELKKSFGQERIKVRDLVDKDFEYIPADYQKEILILSDDYSKYGAVLYVKEFDSPTPIDNYEKLEKIIEEKITDLEEYLQAPTYEWI